MSSSGKEKYTWKEIKVPYIYSNANYIILEEKDILKLLYEDNGKLGVMNSKDFGYSWVKDEDVYELTEDIAKACVKSNYPFNEFKLNHIYYTLNPQLRFMLLDLFDDLSENLEMDIDESLEDKDIEISDSYIDNNVQDVQDIEEIQDVNEIEINDLSKLKDDIIIIKSSQAHIESSIRDILDNQNLLIEKINALENANLKNPSFFKRLFG